MGFFGGLDMSSYWGSLYLDHIQQNERGDSGLVGFGRVVRSH